MAGECALGSGLSGRTGSGNVRGAVDMVCEPRKGCSGCFELRAASPPRSSARIESREEIHLTTEHP
jgi:hypothetical protein